MAPSAHHRPSAATGANALPLYVPHREHPRPAAKTWIQTASLLWSLGKPFNGGEPWLPLTCIEGFIVLGHKDADTAHGEIPAELCVFVRLRAKDYDRLKDSCLWLLQSFENQQPSLQTAWSEALATSRRPFPGRGPENGKRCMAQHALQFLIQHGLVPRQVGVPTLQEYLKSNPRVAWMLDAFASDERLFPLDELHPSRVLRGAIPEQVSAKFKAICYESDETGLHLVLPSGTPKTAFLTEVRARVDNMPALNVSFADPHATGEFLDHAVVSDTSGTPSYHDDNSSDIGDLEITAADLQTINGKVEVLTEARDVLKWGVAQAISMGATDLDYHPLDATGSIIRARYNGRLNVRGRISMGMHTRVLSVVKNRAKLNSVEKRKPQDGKFRVRWGDREAEVRVSTIPVQVGGEQMESCALRVLGRVNIPSIAALGVNEWQQSQIGWVLKRDHGIFLVTGPTGSGKTTTLGCFERAIAGEHINVMSLDDPVEIKVPWVKQSQVQPNIGYTWVEGLEHFLRHDPDVMVIGEVRSTETARIAISAAQTGHLVFATLHTNTAPGALSRLLDLGIERSLIADSILGASAQRLIACLCPNCRERVQAPARIAEYIRRFAARVAKACGSDPVCPDAQDLLRASTEWLKTGETFQAGTCGNCHHSGFNRRRALMEIYLLGNEQEVIDMIANSRPISEIQKHFFASGHLDLAGQAIRSFLQHETTFDEIETLLPLL